MQLCLVVICRRLEGDRIASILEGRLALSVLGFVSVFDIPVVVAVCWRWYIAFITPFR